MIFLRIIIPFFQTCNAHFRQSNRRHFCDLYFRENQSQRSTLYSTRDSIPLFHYDHVDHVLPGYKAIEFSFNCRPSCFDQPALTQDANSGAIQEPFVYLELEYTLVDRDNHELRVLHYLTEQYRAHILNNLAFFA